MDVNKSVPTRMGLLNVPVEMGSVLAVMGGAVMVSVLLHTYITDVSLTSSIIRHPAIMYICKVTELIIIVTCASLESSYRH